jgi:putative ABC transport system permease protein
MPSRWKKVIRDLFENKARTGLITLAIAVGVFAFGSVFITQDVLLENMQTLHDWSRAATVTLYFNENEFDEELVSWMKSQPGVLDAQGRQVESAKIVTENKKYNLSLNGVKDWDNPELNLIKPVEGDWPPKKGEIFFERSYKTLVSFRTGDQVRVELADGRERELTFAGTVYDVNAIPASFDPVATGYVSMRTLAQLGWGDNYNRLEIMTDKQLATIPELEDWVANLKEKLKDRGVTVAGSNVRKPGEHWGAEPTRAFTAILSAVGVFSLILSGFLVVNTITAVLAQQKKQIGIMKAIGGRGKQIAGLYLVLVGFFGGLALLVALPVGMGLGYIFLNSVSNFLNLEVVNFWLPTRVGILEAIAALVVPLVAAGIPIIKGVKTPAYEAMSEVRKPVKEGLVERGLTRIKFLPRPMLISLRNTFRKKGRLAMTLGTLVVGGTLFMTVMNVHRGMMVELLRQLEMFDFEVNVSLGDNYGANYLEKKSLEVNKVVAAETRTGVSGQIIHPNGSKGSRLTIQGVKPETAFAHPTMLAGRWLAKGDKNALVLGSPILADEPNLKAGQTLALEINDKKYQWTVAGIVAMATGSDVKLAYGDFDYVAKLAEHPGMGGSILVKTEPKDRVTQEEVANDLEEDLKRAGVTVRGSETKDEIVSGAQSQFNFLTGFLITMAVMVAIVGGLGLAGTMSLNVMERTREIGVMRSLGATNGAIRMIFWVEGMVIGLLSWIIAIPLSLPMTKGFDLAIGNAFFNRELPMVVRFNGMGLWLVIVLVISSLASILPARRAVQMSVRETLAWE